MENARHGRVTKKLANRKYNNLKAPSESGVCIKPSSFNGERQGLWRKALVLNGLLRFTWKLANQSSDLLQADPSQVPRMLVYDISYLINQ